MGLYNSLAVSMVCPNCRIESEMTVDLYFGLRDFTDYRIGDAYRWTGGPKVENGGRPPEGTMDGEGYAECSSCGKDFFVLVRVKNDLLIGVVPDFTKAPLLP